MKVQGASDNPLEEWQTELRKEVLMLRQLLLLRTKPDDEGTRQQMYPLIKASADVVAGIEQAQAALAKYVMEERAHSKRFQEFQSCVTRQQRRIALMRSQMPPEILDCLSLDAQSEPDSEAAKVVEEPAEVVPPKPKVQAKKHANKPAPVPSKSKPVKKQSRPTAGPAIKKKDSKSAAPTSTPVITTVSESELSSAPQYVKGRLTCAKIDTVVNKLNEIVSAKYALLARPYRDLNSNEITSVQSFQESECEETKGKQFITDTEIKGFGSFRLDATAKSVINMLRHVGSLKEVRGKNKARIFIINQDGGDE